MNILTASRPNRFPLVGTRRIAKGLIKQKGWWCVEYPIEGIIPTIIESAENRTPFRTRTQNNHEIIKKSNQCNEPFYLSEGHNYEDENVFFRPL